MIKRLNHFKLICELGRGGSGIVYKALDTRLKRHVAIKILNPRPDFRNRDISRFLLEAQAASSLNHPNICTIFDIGKHNKNNYIVMELVEGKTLRQIIEEGKRPTVNEAIEIILQICQALSIAHKNSIIHRDIKPDNILITKDNHIKITDFGLAKLKEIEPDSNKQSDEEVLLKNVSFKTTITTFLGTIAYMSPEQIEKKQVDERSDIFSLGIVIFELLMGESPFSGNTNVQIMQSILNTDVKPKLKNKKFSSINGVIIKSLEKEKNNRYQNVEKIINDLEIIKSKRDKRKLTKIISGVSIFVLAILLIISINWKHENNDLTITRSSSGGSTYPLNISYEYQGWSAIYPMFSLDDNAILMLLTGVGDDNNHGLYKKDLLTGKTELLTEQPSVNAPDLNPDGSKLAYMTPDGIYISDINFETKNKISDFGWRPRWSPDGEKISFSKRGRGDQGLDNQIYFYDLKNDVIENISPANALNYSEADWSSDGKWIVCCGGVGSQWEIWFINIYNGFAKQITDFGEWISSPKCDPSGRYIYYISNRDGADKIYQIKINKNKDIIWDKPKLTTQHANVRHIDLSHDGDKIVFISTDEKYSIHRTKFYQYRLMPKISETIFSHTGEILNFEVSALENMVVAEAFDNGIRSLILKSIGKQTPQILYQEQNSFSPSWSNDGKWIAFDAGGGDNADIWKIPVTGGSAEKIIEHNGADWVPSFSPNGNYLGFISNRSGQFELWLMELKSGNTEQITNSPELEGRAWWSHDSKKIAFFTIGEKRKNSSIWIYDIITKEFNEISAAKRYLVDIAGSGLHIHSRFMWNKTDTGLIIFPYNKGPLVEIDLENNSLKPIMHFDSLKVKPTNSQYFNITDDYFYYLANESKQEIWMVDGLKRDTTEVKLDLN
jgi:serine/threonine protein kinase